MVKVKDLAEEVGMDPKEVIAELKKTGIMVFNLNSPIPDILLSKAKSHLNYIKTFKVEEEIRKQKNAARKKAISKRKSLKNKKKSKEKEEESSVADTKKLKIRKIKKVEEVKEKEAEEKDKKEEILEKETVSVKEKKSAKIEEKDKEKGVDKEKVPEEKEKIVERETKQKEKEIKKEKGTVASKGKYKKGKKDFHKSKKETFGEREKVDRKKTFKKDRGDKNLHKRREEGKREEKTAGKIEKEAFKPIVIEINKPKKKRRGEVLKSTSSRDSRKVHEERNEKSLFAAIESSRKKKKKKKRKKEEKVVVEETINETIKGVKKVSVPEGVNVKELAERLEINSNEIIKVLFTKGYLIKINDILNESHLELIGKRFGFDIEVVSYEEDMFEMDILESDSSELVPRPPIVTVMGHVDHGKTTLLDTIRQTNVVDKEAGKITQHIGAYTVEKNGRKITFIDTPGHEAFTMMRARGAKLTDIVVLVVAADDGVKEQTIEAIHHAEAAGVPVIVAINKIDLPNANPERIKQDLSKFGLMPEEWGGKTIFVEVSAKKGQNIDELLEMILLSADMLELVANPNSSAYGTVIEAKLDPGRGPVATLLVQNGTLKEKDFVVAGSITGKIRAMFDDFGKRVKEAGPSTPVEVLGLENVPVAGDKFFSTDNHLKAKKLSEFRKNKIKNEMMAKQQSKISLENIFDKMQEGEIKELPIILKVDVNGSKEAIENLLSKIESEKVKIKVIYSAVGAITDNDVMLASASNAIIVGFNVKPTSSAEALAKKENVDIRFYRVIYNIEKDIKSAMEGLLEPEEEEKYLGKVEARKIFKIPKVGTVIGGYVLDGVATRNANCRIIRDGIVVYEGKISSLKRFKQDVSEVKAGFECGIGIEKFNDVKEGDILEIFTIEEVKQELE